MGGRFCLLYVLVPGTPPMVVLWLNRIVVTLFNATRYPFPAKMTLIGVVIHIFA
jgi:hypothetical protein